MDPKRWAEVKALQPTGGVAGPAGRRKNLPCNCNHTLKHHKKSGRCRGECECVAGIR